MNTRTPTDGDFLLYTTPDGNVRVEVLVQNETVWLPQQKIADIFGVERSVITKHLQNIYTDGELSKGSTCAKIAQVQMEGCSIEMLSKSYNFPVGDKS